jgi:hypothetical protein
MIHLRRDAFAATLRDRKERVKNGDGAGAWRRRRE